MEPPGGVRRQSEKEPPPLVMSLMKSERTKLQGFSKARSLAFFAGSTKALPLRFGFSIVSTKALPLRNFFGNSACSVSQEHEGPAS